MEESTESPSPATRQQLHRQRPPMRMITLSNLDHIIPVPKITNLIQ
ncbi:C2 domain-containing protein [Psidium guajava]|nr:C2 domain-containing protein [Psidium guajava]